MLGTYFLKETLGTLGKLGCAICLIGSVIIVLHAPADEEIDRIDEMLNYAIQPGLFCRFLPPPLGPLHAYRLNPPRLPVLRALRHHILGRHDLQGVTRVRQEEPAGVHLHLQHGGVVDGAQLQGVRDCPEIDVCGHEPVHLPQHLCVPDRHGGVHPNADELLQQGAEPVRQLDV